MTTRKDVPVSKNAVAAVAIAIALAHGAPVAAADASKEPAAKPAPVKGADVAKAEAARKKPLQRCDELADKAQTECFRKARERIVEARQKREASGKAEDKISVKTK